MAEDSSKEHGVAKRESGRIAQLRAETASVPPVETTLDDFIARANELDLTPSQPLAVGSEPFERPDRNDIEDRVRIAEAKAAKAIAAAKAAAAGLTVSSADLAAIEHGLVVPAQSPARPRSWRIAIGSLIAGGALAFATTFVLLHRKSSASTVTAPSVSTDRVESVGHSPAPALAQPHSAPVVTPIETIEQPHVAAPVPVDARPAAVATKPAPVVAKPPRPHVDTKPDVVAKPRAKKQTEVEAAEPSGSDQPPSSGLVDPF
jgi:hypothetical protein